MSQKEKLVERFLTKPKDFTYEELKSLLRHFGYTANESGNGSRVRFYNQSKNSIIKIHKPHPENTLKSYVIDEVYETLKGAGYFERLPEL